ncbi:MAG: pilus assembly PilX N-terminal domain-containing protein, partial [Clostridia bacterium]|nr:pilus assembly PilX N-terminal domain-containing protein [Clostridia bacterium]
MNRFLREENGAALVTTLIFMIVVSILIATLFTVSVADARHASLQKNNTQAYYVAKSGANLGLEKIIEMLTPENVGDLPGYVGNEDNKEDIIEFVEDLNAWATSNNPFTIGSNQTVILKFENIVNTRDIKIVSTGTNNNGVPKTEVVTLKMTMLTSVLIEGKATEWYSGKGNNTMVLEHGIDPNDPNKSYIGKGVMLEGKDNQPSKFPSNGGESIFQASVIQALPTDRISLLDSGSSSDITFDVEIILFSGGIAINDLDRALNLSLSDELALNKVTSKDSVLYITDDAPERTQIITDGGTRGVGFENQHYYKYFTNTDSLTATGFDYANYKFNKSTYTKYGIVFFGDKVVRLGPGDKYKDDDVLDRIPKGDVGETAEGFYFFPDGINLNGDPDELSGLIPLDKDDPLVKVL